MSSPASIGPPSHKTLSMPRSRAARAAPHASRAGCIVVAGKQHVGNARKIGEPFARAAGASTTVLAYPGTGSKIRLAGFTFPVLAGDDANVLAQPVVRRADRELRIVDAHRSARRP